MAKIIKQIMVHDSRRSMTDITVTQKKVSPARNSDKMTLLPDGSWVCPPSVSVDVLKTELYQELCYSEG